MSGVIARGAELAGRAIVGLGREVLGMALDAAALEGVTNTFTNLVEVVGDDAVDALEQLRSSTRGMVSDADLMGAGNKFLAMGLAGSAEEMAQLAEVATQLGMAMGEDATSSMENFALMMANQSLPRLDSFGISSGKARERILELMESTAGMTREMAFNQAVMEQAAVAMEKVGEQGETSAAKMAAMGATMENLRLKGGQALQPLLDMAVGVIGDLVDVWGAKLEDWLVVIQGPIQDFAGALEALFAGDWLGFLWGIQDALIGLGVPEEDVDRIVVSLHTLWSAFQDLMDGDVEEFIGKVKAVLLEWGVPIEFIDKMEEAFRWLLEAATKVGTYWEETLKPAIKTGWELVFKPALEGLQQFFIDFKPLLLSVGAALLLGIVGPMLLAAVPVVLLGAAVVALGLLWKKHGEEVTQIWEQLKVVGATVFGDLIDWIITFLETIASGEGVLGTLFGGLDFGGLLDNLDEAKEKLDAMRYAKIEMLTATPAVESQLDRSSMGSIGELLSGLFAQGAQDNRNFTNYGGIQLFGNDGNRDPLAALWEMGQ
jgi:hypothetical protein